MAETFPRGGENEDPLVSFHFALEVRGVVTGYFTEVSGIGSESEVVEQKHQLPDGKVGIRKVPGLQKWGDVTLKRGITSVMDVWDWRQDVIEGKVDAARANGSITMFDQQLNPVARWDFVNAWPSKVSGPSLKSDDNSFGIEEMTVVHEGIWRKQ
jgi:phage tail-like protein